MAPSKAPGTGVGSMHQFHDLLRTTNLDKTYTNELLIELRSRQQSSVEFSDTLILMTGFWFGQSPRDIVDLNMFLVTWRLCIQHTDALREIVLKQCYMLLDFLVTNDADSKKLLYIKQSTIWFLGEYANYITGEYLSKGKVIQCFNGKEYELGDIQNKALVSILLRLQEHAVYGTWGSRRASLEALATISFRSNEPTRFIIYQFFWNMATYSAESHASETVGMDDIVIPTLATLDRIYKYRVDVTSEDVDPFTKEELQDHGELELLQRARMFTHLPDGYTFY